MGVKRREVGMAVILTIVTCGIYGIVWMIGLVDDLNSVSNEPNQTSGITVWLLSIVTCGIYYLIWLYKAGSRIDEIRMRNNMPSNNKGMLYCLLAVFGLSIVSMALLQEDINSLIDVNSNNNVVY